MSCDVEPKLSAWQLAAVHGLPDMSWFGATLWLPWMVFFLGWLQWSGLYLLCICESPTVHMLSISALYNVASGKFCSLQDLCTHIFVMLWLSFWGLALICLSIPNILDSSFYTFESTWWIGIDTFSMFQKLPCQHFLSSVHQCWKCETLCPLVFCWGVQC